MTDEKKPAKKATTAASAPKAAPKKQAVPKASPSESETKAAPKRAAAKSGATVTVKQTGSSAKGEAWVMQTLKGLGLGKMNRVKTLEDTPAVRGMIARVHHLVTVQDAA